MQRFKSVYPHQEIMTTNVQITGKKVIKILFHDFKWAGLYYENWKTLV